MGVLVVVVLLLIVPSESYRLNVPRVLLPYHPSATVSFELVVSDPEGGCFNWRSTRPDIVSVHQVGDRACSDRAVIVSNSKHVEEQTAVVFAEDRAAQVVLSCGVSVDLIRSISISTTTKVLFLDASPAKIVVHAANSEGDVFSSLGEIPFEWSITTESSDRPLRIIPFSQSKYEAPHGVRALEESRKRGYVVLLEGVSTGAATLKASLAESFFEEVPSREIDLLVVANVILMPSHDVYLPIGARLPYSAHIIKQTSHQPVSLPSKQYRLLVSDESVCSFDEERSVVTAIKLGSTHIAIIDHNVKAKHVVKPPSAYIHVVSPWALSWRISGGSWYLQQGEQYDIAVQLIDSHDNLMFIPQNALFETSIPQDYFHIESASDNGTFFHVTAIRTGVIALSSTFISTIDEKGERWADSAGVRGERVVTISEKVVVSPRDIVLPYHATQQHSYLLKASGGTGVYVWGSDESKVASVDETGLVRAQGIGQTQVHVNDNNNPLNKDHVLLTVLPPVSISFQKSRRETQIGSSLELWIGMAVQWNNELLSVTDCTNIDFTFSVADTNVFTVLQDHTPRASLTDEGCSSVLLKAVGDGDTTLTLSTAQLSVDIVISAYPALQLESSSTLLLSLGSGVELLTKGGPRPWVIDPSAYFSKVTYSESVHLIAHRSERGRHFLYCRQAQGDIVVGVRVGNDKTESNPMPSVAYSEMRVCCSMPSRLSLAVIHNQLIQSNACPVNTQRIVNSSPSQLVLSAYGKCESGLMSGVERRFDSISALLVQFSTDEPKLLTVQVSDDQPDASHLYASAVPQGRVGVSEIVAKTEKYRINGKEVSLRTKLWTAIDMNIVHSATVQPPEVVVWNEKSTVKRVEIVSGSQHFEVEPSFDEAVANVQLKNNNVLEIRPSGVGRSVIPIVDVCFGSRLLLAVTVTDLHHIALHTPHFVAVNEEISVRISLSDANGTEFSSDDVARTSIELTSDSATAVNIIREEPLKYRIQGIAVGVVSLSASARTASGHELRSVPEVLQVFSPLQLLPKQVTLIPGSVFQLEVVGGPEPTPALTFSLNDSSVASVAGNGLITSIKLGVTSILGTLNVGGTDSSKASVTVRVVSLKGIRIVLSSHRLEQGTEGWARVEGLAQQETPFSFGGALHPLRIVWTLHTHSNIQMLSSSGCPTQEHNNNQFEVLLKALEHGHTQLHVAVHMHPLANYHFASGRVFEDTVTISVVEPIRLVQPSILPQAIRLTPGASFNLKPNRADGAVRVGVASEYSSVASVQGGGVLKALSQGQAIIKLTLLSNSHNESAFVPIQVLPVHSIHLTPHTVIPIRDNDAIGAMYPLGYRITLTISFRDHAGRMFDATDVDVSYRPHRFDKTRITMSDDRTMLTVHLKKEGDTVIKVWDTNNPAVSAFLRLSVTAGIRPSGSTVTVGDIVCFKSWIACGAWRESVQDSHLNMLKDGMAVASKQGTAVIVAHVDTDQSLFTEVIIEPADEIRMVRSPLVVSNIANKRFVFPVLIGNDSDAVNVHGCDAADIDKLEGLVAPFECFVSFESESTLPASSVLMADAVFVSSIGSYACVLSEGLFGSSRELISNDKMQLLVKASWTRPNKVLESSWKSSYLARFELDPLAIHLNNVRSQQAHVTITAPKSVLGSIRLEGCAEGVLVIGRPKQVTSTSAKYSIKLNVNSGTLWRELLKECNVTISSDLTGQILQLHTKITLHGDASKAVLNASEGMMSYVSELVGNSMMAIGTLVVTFVCVLLVIAHKKGYSVLPHLLGDSVSAQPQSGAVFASDRQSPSPGYAAWRSMTHKVVSPSSFGRGFAEGSSPQRQTPSSNKSGGFSPARPAPLSPPETFLWSTGDSLNTPNAMRDGKYS